MPSGLPIDITNPDDIRAKLPELEALIRAKRQEADKLDSLADDLARIAKVKRREPSTAVRRKPKAQTTARTPSTRRLAVAIVKEADRAMSIEEVTEQIDPPTKRETVGWALWDAATNNPELWSPSKGMYAPLGWKPETPGDLLSTNGARPAAEREDSPQR
jgi:hypothetical protein